MPAAKKAAPPVDPKRAAREQTASENPGAWIPIDVDDSITGTMVDLDIGWSDVKDAEYPIITLDVEGRGEVKVHCMAAALEGEVKRKRPLPGEQLTFSYHGQGEAKQRGRSGAHLYRLRIAGRGTEAVASMYDRMEANNRRTAGGGGGTPPPTPPAADAAPSGDDEDIPF